MRMWLWVLAAAVTLGIAAQDRAEAQAYPSKPVKIINDSAPGSATDVAARLTAERLSTVWGQQVIVENKPGAGGSLAVRAASEAPNDGYTLYVGAASTFTALKGAPGVMPGILFFATADPAYLDKNNATAVHAAVSACVAPPSRRSRTVSPSFAAAPRISERSTVVTLIPFRSRIFSE